MIPFAMTSSLITTMFFDFYMLNLLRDFANRKNMIYFHSKQYRIDEMTEIATDHFFDEVYWALYYSCVREFRHCRSESDIDFSKEEGRVMDTVKRYLAKYKSARTIDENYREVGGHFEKILEVNNVSLSAIYESFKLDHLWHSGYGGRLWADGCSFLLKLPKNHSEKVIWIDRVLDLYHNNGPLLDKTVFGNLFDGFDAYEFLPDSKAGKYNDCALDFRAEASLPELKACCSRRVRNLVTANQRIFPDALLTK